MAAIGIHVTGGRRAEAVAERLEAAGFPRAGATIAFATVHVTAATDEAPDAAAPPEVAGPLLVAGRGSEALATMWGVREGRPGSILGAGTVHGSACLRAALAERLEVAADSIVAVMAGTGGLGGLPLWSSAHVGGVPLPRYLPKGKRPLTVQERSHIAQTAREQAEAGLDDAGAIAASVAIILGAIRDDARLVLPVAAPVLAIGGEPGPLVRLAWPAIVGRAGVVRTIDEWPLNDAETAGLRAIAERLAGAATP